MLRSIEERLKNLVKRLADFEAIRSGQQALDNELRAIKNEPRAFATKLEAIEKMQQAIHKELLDHRKLNQALHKEITATNQRVSKEEENSKSLIVKFGTIERLLRRFDNQKISNNTTNQSVEKKTNKKSSDVHLTPLHFDYVGFEDCFRGSESLIKQRQSVYLKYLRQQSNVLDIGCGRGEFLQILKENGIESLGIDLSLDMVLLCKEKGLQASQAKACDYLAELDKNSLGGIFMGQVVEHLLIEELNELFNLCFSRLNEKGILIVETMNPHCEHAMKWFYLDPTHNKPVFPEFLTYLARSKGFADTCLEYLSPVTESVEMEEDITLFSDYALIACKAKIDDD